MDRSEGKEATFVISSQFYRENNLRNLTVVSSFVLKSAKKLTLS
jgi:hypothetical protein